MVAAFSFGFAGDDIDDDGPPEIDRGLNSEHYPVTHTISLPVKRHSLESLVSNALCKALIVPQNNLICRPRLCYAFAESRLIQNSQLTVILILQRLLIRFPALSSSLLPLVQLPAHSHLKQ